MTERTRVRIDLFDDPPWEALGWMSDEDRARSGVLTSMSVLLRMSVIGLVASVVYVGYLVVDVLRSLPCMCH